MADGPSLPGVDDEHSDEERIVLHVDADCFYAACERLREPELEGEPVVVGMGYEPGDTVGAVATASYEAREFGVESAQGIESALERLPRRAEVDDDPELSRKETGYYRPVDMEYYQSVAEDVRAILHDCADVVREVSIDEAYLDVTDRTAWSVADGFARHVKDRIRREVGITVSIGVAPSMSAAKIASDFDKPDGLTVVEPGTVGAFLAPLEVDLLHGVGPVTARELRSMGLETASDVAEADPNVLVDRFGERGRDLYEQARGEDDRQVEPKGLPKSFSRESAFDGAVEEPEPKLEVVDRLADAVAARAQREGAMYRTVGVKAVTPPFEISTRERSLPGPVDDPDLVADIARDLFAEFETEPVRKLGVKVANLEFSEVDQASLDGWEGVGGGADVRNTDGLREESADAATVSDGNSSEVNAGAEHSRKLHEYSSDSRERNDSSASGGADSTSGGADSDTNNAHESDPQESEPPITPEETDDGQLSLGAFANRKTAGDK
ncbi:DNA polymerase IV [Halobacteria archaeon AArc-curdl1]|uniref:DNA polymerase IV n=1 Tax=Natronosalvus hydrolyticus TaxID=2979988 RepID=A0AAP2Z859_9EURY|nr:DNA polymerase IV [Halobacteria archaeon AArc-curdl1]